MKIFLSKTVISNTLHLLSEKVIKVLVVFFVGLYVIRYLGPNDFGILSYVLSIVALITPFSNIAYPTITVRELVKAKIPKAQILFTAFQTNLVSATALYLLLIVISYLTFDFFLFVLILILGLRIPLGAWNTTIDSFFKAGINSKYSAYSRSTGLLIGAGIKVLLMAGSFTMIWFVAAESLEIALVAIILCYMFYRKSKLDMPIWKFDRHVAKKMISDSWPILLTNAFIAVDLKVDQLIIHSLLDSEQVGLYAAAAKISEGWYFMPMIFLSSVFPLLVQENESENGKSKEQIEWLCGTFFYSALSMSVLIYFVADDFLPFLLGKEYLASATILKIHIWASIFNFIGRPVKNLLIIKNQVKFHLLIRSSAAILNIVLNYLFIPYWGIAGAAIATLCSYAAGSFLGYAIFNQTRPYFFMQLQGILLPFRFIQNKLT